MKKYNSIPIPHFDPNYLIAAIFAAGISLRISGLTTSAIWYDEAISFEAAKLPFLSMVEATKFTFSPPLWGILLWFSTRLFGENELGLRLPALIAGVFSLLMTYQITSDFRLSKNQKIAVMAFASLLPYQVAMAQDGRMYTVLSVLYLCALWFALRRRWMGLTGCSGLLLYTHYTAPFYLIAIYAIAALNNISNKKHILKVFASGLLAILSFLPWVNVYVSTLAIKSPISPLSLTKFLTMFYQISFDNTLTGTLFLFPAIVIIAASMLLGLILFSRQLFILAHNFRYEADGKNLRFINKNLIRYLQLTIFGLLPLGIMVIWSLAWENFIYYRLLAAMLIPIIIWSVYTVAQATQTRQLASMMLLIWAALIFTSLLLWSPQTKAGDLRDIADLINEHWQDGDIIYHITGTSYLPFSQYLGQKPEFLIDEQQHEWLLPTQLQDRFGIKRQALEKIPYQRAWIIFSRDNLVSTRANDRALKYIQNATLVGVVKAWRFSPIEVFLLTSPVSP